MAVLEKALRLMGNNQTPDRKECLTPDSPFQGRCFLDAAPELIAGIEAKNSFPLDATQGGAIQNEAGPLLIAAGSGTGKTEVLVACCSSHLLRRGGSRCRPPRRWPDQLIQARLSGTLAYLIPYSYQPGDLIASLKKLVL